MSKRKQGEQEAVTILERLGIEIDKDYYDDNSQQSMPDIRYLDGRYIEVTHTLHNNAIPKGGNKYNQLRDGEDWDDHFQRHLDVERRCHQALDRIRNCNYERDDMGNLTEAGLVQYKQDAKLVKDHLGYDYMERDITKKHSEFNCDCPSINHSVDNILKEISEDKAKKYPDGKTDLFIYATSDEFRLMKDLLSQVNRNIYANGFLYRILQSPFPKVYVCEWDFQRQEYNTVATQLVLFYKCDDGVKWEWYNV